LKDFKPYPEAIKWLGKEPVECYLDLLSEHPAQMALDDLDEDHPAHDTLMKTLTSSVGRQTVCNLLSFSLPRFTFSRMSLADLVQT